MLAGRLTLGRCSRGLGTSSVGVSNASLIFPTVAAARVLTGLGERSFRVVKGALAGTAASVPGTAIVPAQRTASGRSGRKDFCGAR